jgi:hypothetical protein
VYGLGFIVTVIDSDIIEQGGLPVTVSVNITLPATTSAALGT